METRNMNGIWKITYAPNSNNVGLQVRYMEGKSGTFEKWSLIDYFRHLGHVKEIKWAETFFDF